MDEILREGDGRRFLGYYADECLVERFRVRMVDHLASRQLLNDNDLIKEEMIEHDGRVDLNDHLAHGRDGANELRVGLWETVPFALLLQPSRYSIEDGF